MPDSRTASAHRLRRIASRARTLATVYIAILFTATHVPMLPTSGYSWMDKVEHLFAYGFLTLCVLVGWELTVGVLQAKHYFAVWLAGTFYAAIDEVTQIPVGRTCDVNDWAADLVGIAIGLIVFRMIRGPLYRMLFVGDAFSVQ